MLELIFWLFVGHAVADFALQHDYIAKAKNPTDPAFKGIYGWVLGAHAMIHAGVVTYATGFVWLGLAEAVVHASTDYAKCRGWFGQGDRAYHIDQGIHYASKIVWAVIAVSMGVQ